MTTETHAIPCRCGATLTEETYDLHMHANHRTPERMREDQERAAEARHGGRMFCQFPHARVWEPETLRYAALILAMPSEPDRPTLLPESAFDWPIYRAAMTTLINDTADATCADCGHNERDHHIDPSTRIAWCYWCHDEYRPFDD